MDSNTIYTMMTDKIIDKQKQLAKKMWESLLGSELINRLEEDNIDKDINEIMDVILDGTEEVVEALLRTTFTEDEVKVWYEFTEKLAPKTTLLESKLQQYYSTIEEEKSQKVQEYLVSKGLS